MMIIVMIVAMIAIKVLPGPMHGSCRHREPCIDACTCMPRHSVAVFRARVGSQRHSASALRGPDHGAVERD